jgi:hypothetical protein
MTELTKYLAMPALVQAVARLSHRADVARLNRLRM